MVNFTPPINDVKPGDIYKVERTLYKTNKDSTLERMEDYEYGVPVNRKQRRAMLVRLNDRAI